MNISGPKATPDVAPNGDTVTPMMRQYQEIKAANPDSLLFYRMGDFYELFFHDAETASRALGIVLTRRGKHQGADIPMCGVPVVRAEEYLHKLIAAGFRVAVCEQTEDPAEAKKRGAKSVVQRDVTRLITAGTLTEDTLLDRREIIVAPRIEQRAFGRPAHRRHAARGAAQQLSRGDRARARVVTRRGGAVRTGFPRHLDWRIPRDGVRPSRACGRDRAHRAGRDHRVGCALRRSGACTVSAHAPR